MKAVFALFLLISSTSYASQSRPTGIGFILGAPTGLSLQLNANTPHPINLGLAYHFNHWTQIWGDYTFHYPQFFDNTFHTTSHIDSYIGIGGALLLLSSKYSTQSLGILFRVPFGLEYHLQNAPFGFMAELAPGLSIAPSTDFFFQGGIGARFYF